MDFQAMTDRAVLEEIGHRVQLRRLNLNLSQLETAHKAGLSRRALQNLENRGVCTLASLLRVLRALGDLPQLDAVLPAPGPSPLQLAQLKGRERKRAGKPRPRQQTSQDRP
jgi:transcriptional regulator with XRE-family HTH domain